MPKVFYALVILFISNVIVYFYCCTSAFLIVLIFSICLLLISLPEVSIADIFSAYHRRRGFLISKEHYTNIRRIGGLEKMSGFQRRISVSGREESGFDSGLLSDYDSRRLRTSLKSYDATSPLRTFSKHNISRDENYHSKQTFSPSISNIQSPSRAISPSIRSSPLSHSKRYNLNLEFEDDSFQSRSSLLNEDKLSISSPGSRKMNPPSMGFDTGSGFVSKITATANEMRVHEFPCVASSAPIIPLISSPLRDICSPNHRSGSPYRDSGSETPKRNRVRVRLAGPNQSDISLNNSSHDMSSNLDGSCTTKSVIQVLKEISRKRALIPNEEEEHQEPKRRPEHNVYLSRHENEEENPVPSRPNTEDDRKRVREPDWDTSNITGPKRRRKNNHIVNNEILSSLSSSIGLQIIQPTPAVEKRKQTVSIGTQVSLLKDTPDKKQSEQSAQTSSPKPLKEVKEAATMPDPPPPPRTRSPVKEKVVTDLNVILKSALSKFKILPKEDSMKPNGPPSSLNSPLSAKADNEIPSTITPNVSDSVSVSNPIPSTGLSNQPTLTPVAQPAFGSQTTALIPPVSSTSNIMFGSPFSLNGKTPEKATEESSKKTETQNTIVNLESSAKKEEPKSGLTGFQFSPSSDLKSGSPFGFGLQTSTVAPPSAPEHNKIVPFKGPEISTSASIPTASAQAIFSFGSPKPENTTSVTKISTVATTMQSTSTFPQANSTSLVPAIPVNDTTKNEPFKFGNSGFTFKDKSNEKSEQPKEEKKVVSTNGVFSFGKSENKPATTLEKTETKPFQFGTGGFTFGQTPNQSKDAPSNGLIQSSKQLQTATTDNKNSLFSFSGSAGKKDEKPGGFSFKLPQSTTAPGSEQKAVFSFSAAPTSTAAAVVTSTPTISASSDSKPIFPASLFGSTTSATTVTSTTALVSTSVNTNNMFTSVATFGNSTNDPTKPSFSAATTTSIPTFGSTAPSFGTVNKTVFGNNPTTTASSTPLFGSGISSNQATGSSIFGNTNSNPPAFSTTTPTFGATGSTSNAVVPAFGSTTTGNTPSFGNPATTTTPAFGGSVTAAPTFGSTGPSSTSTTGFAGVTPAGSSAPTFGTTLPSTTAPTFGATSTSTPTFGSIQTTTASLFGTSTSGTTVPAFGGASSNPPTFGSTTAVASAVTPFGSSSTAPAFGSSTSAFGGSSSAPAPAFGSQPQAGFSSQATTFGSTPAFGQSTASPFGGASSFGGQSTTPAFGTTGGFGSSSSSTFSATPTPAFGSTSTPSFGSTPAFGTQEPNKPFTFNAPASQTPAPAAGGFNFTAAPQPQAPSGGLFQFGASTSTQPSQPFQFNAAQPNSTVGGTGQQMFSIGSGSTAPRRVTGRRKK